MPTTTIKIDLAHKEKEMVQQRDQESDGRILLNESIVSKIPSDAIVFCVEKGCKNYGQFQVNLSSSSSSKSFGGIVLCYPHFTKWFKIMMKEEKERGKKG
jgi:hypothetical protein